MILALLMSASLQDTVKKGETTFLTDHQAAVAKAKETGRPLYLYFWSHG